ncbi:hypothetical protein FGU71_12250 [Erythrobacter insulae]|uniref:Uncharacterized protein n=1 Tax=Erythrobacter insulae TaxID=2584124 RepID=A0A547PEL7_9SPHN|nr:hypothetical protein [Erythrobacter insulae]TRD12558.1 hypothetical protein FGU71_12250 [Erythrobacter insulae]
MSKTATEGNNPHSDNPVETPDVELILKDELTRGDRALRGVPPVLTHMLSSSRYTLVTDAIVARLRGMIASLAAQLIAARDGTSKPSSDAAALDYLSENLTADSVVLSYCYALAMEGHLSERLEQRASIDPILSPLLQELIASQEPATAELAMTTLAAQSRFIQSQRRMELPLSELPAELFHAVLKRFERTGKGDPQIEPLTGPAIRKLKDSYDEGASRVGLLARLISSMKGGAIAALELEHAGLALFASAMSTFSKQPRELAVLACHEGQAARLTLSLRAANVSIEGIERQFLLLEPSERLPRDIEAITARRAAAILKQTQTPNES